MFAEVVVLTYQSPAIKTFTYKVPKNLEAEIKTGQLIEVPFGQRRPFGITTGLASTEPKTHAGIKPIDAIILNNPILLPYQIDLLFWMSKYYLAPIVNCLETMTPKIPKSLINKYQFSSKKQNPPLILVPTINRILQIMATLPNAKSPIVYHNELSLNQKFFNWQKIISGNCDYIIGTRSTIFAPCPNLQKIIIYDEHENAYKDERSPYFDTLTVAEKLSELTKSKIQIFDSSPKITTFANHKNDVHLQISKKFVPRIQTLSMLDEKASGNKSPISALLATYLKLGIKKQKRILLFLNKKNEAGHFFCKNCQFSNYAKKQPETCPNCNSADIWFYSLNIKTLSSLVLKIVPDATINMISESTRNLTSENGAIDIGTSHVFYSLLQKKYDLVAHISTDSLLNISDFTSSEKLFAQITDLKKIARGLLLLQTYNPDHLVIKTAAQSNYSQFFKTHLEERRALSYPPFSILIKISQKGKKAENVYQKSQKILDTLNKIKSSLPTTHYPLPTILGPYEPVLNDKVSRYNIVLKAKLNNYSLASREKIIEKLTPIFLSNLPSDCQIIIEPNNLN